MTNRQISVVLIIGVLLIWVVFAVVLAYKPPQADELARSPYWYDTHCEYIPLVIADHVPDGIYVECK